MGLLTTIAALLRRRRVERGVLGLVFALTAATSFVVTTAPRLFSNAADAGIRHAISGATAAQGSLEFQSFAQIGSATDSAMGGVEARGKALRGSLPASLKPLVGDTQYVVDTARVALSAPPNFATTVSFRIASEIDEETTIVEGRRPARVDAPVADNQPIRLEITISEASAATTLMRVGETYVAHLDPTDPLRRSFFPRPSSSIEITVVGIYSVNDRTAAYWFDDTKAVEARIGGTTEHPIAFVTALIAPDAYPILLGEGLTSWRIPIDARRIDAGQLGALVPDLRQMALSYPSTTRDATVALRTGLSGIIGRFQAQEQAAGAALSVAAIGPLSVAAGTIGIVAVLIIRRRRAEILLARSRGASSLQLLVTQVTEGLLVTVPAAALGATSGFLVVPARSEPAAIIGAGLVAVASTALLLLAAWNTAARSRRRTEREESGPPRIAARRLVLDAVVIGIALTSVWLLRERGLSGGESLARGSSAGGQVAGSDPFLALSPVLIGIAVGLLTLRIYPLPVRALGALAARRRDLVPVLALREVGRKPAASYLPLLILTVTMALGSFASVIQVTIERGQVAASWLNLGADYVVSAIGDVPLGPSVDPASLDGVVAAVGHREVSAQFIPDPVLVGGATLLAIDPTAYQAVLRDDPRPVQFPSAMAGAVPAGDVGSTDVPIPAILSARLATSPVELVVGDQFDLVVRNQRLTFRVAAIAEEFPGMGTRTDFVIAPFDWVAGAFVPGAIQPTTYFVRGGPDLADALQTRVEEQSVSAVMASRYVAYGALHDAPLVAAVSRGFLLSLLVAAVYAALAVVAAVILDAQRRSREIGQLRTLGATDRQVTGLTLIQHGLPTLVALLIGTTLGVGVAWLVEPGLRLAAFIGPGARVRLEINPDSIAVVDVLVVGSVAAAVAASTVLAQRLDLGRILRIGEE